jgi:hypothetical protein
LIKPCEFAVNLQGKLARWRDDQGKGGGSRLEPLGTTEEIPCNRKPVRDGFARAGLRRNEKVAVDSRVREHGCLHRRRLIVVASRQGSGERRTCG